ncbi:hypothetical protein HHL19_11260 [Streptomyces sp. R302]|uniref:hypothetical protein n=1 Tax=unclassified Streptomyces TaxID=2593676 RepID=UPI00145CE1AC|nr:MULTISPECIES: hypothetical protein [unclassified Streptomyces]NML50241.1 hypothetical protein [Streptomyces sp. R301]NML79232.1 hypothetical protein [Streptomyces sp. R302]
MSARPRALRAAFALAASVALALGAAAPAVSAAPVLPVAGGDHGWPHPDLAKTYEATKKYRSEEKAIADGFQRTDVCVEDTSDAKLGGMGYHYVNPANIGSTDPTRPAAVIYAEDHGDGKRKLVALEWVVPDTGQPVPRAFDRNFDGPDLIPGLGEVYSLHAWIYKKNPAGVFAPYNPRVHCGPCPK